MMKTIVLQGVGPSMRVTVETVKPSTMLVISRSKTQKIKLTSGTNVRFAA